MNLVDQKDFAKAANLSKIGGDNAAKVLMMILKLNKLNKLYSKLPQNNPVEFIDTAFNELGIKYEISEDDIKKIPKTGSFITISNHPYGGIDDVLLIKIISKIRSNYKLLANDLIKKIDPLKNSFLAANPFKKNTNQASYSEGTKAINNHISEGKPLGVFPASEVSTFNSDNNGISDPQWQNITLKFLKEAKVPVVPIYFHGSNSKLFHLLGLIHPKLRNIKLPSELFNKKKKPFKIRIGNPISVKDQNSFTDISRYGRFLRAKTYSLGTAIEVKKFFLPGLKRLRKKEEIIDTVPKFNNALDGLIILDLYDVPIETITSLSKEINDDSILERFFKNDYNYLK